MSFQALVSTSPSGDVRPSFEVEELQSRLQHLDRKGYKVKQPKKVSVAVQVLSGTVASLLAECVLFPIDTVKIHVQSDATGGADGFLATAGYILRKGGIMAFFGGLRTSVFKEMIHSSNYWIWHSVIFRFFSKTGDNSRTPALKRLLLNLVTKQLNWLCTTPFEVVSSVNQITPGTPGFFAVANMLYKGGGLAVFYRGLAVSMALAINPAIMNTLITSLLQALATLKRVRYGMDELEAREHSPAAIGMVTALSKAFSTVISYPLIRAKVLQQTGILGAELGVLETFRRILAMDGALGLYRGLLAMSYKTVLWNSIMMTFKNMLQNREATPPATPLYTTAFLPTMGRELFPYDMLTEEKIDQILTHLRLQGSSRQIDKMEKRLAHVTDDVREIKALLREVVAKSDPSFPVSSP